MRLGKQLGVGKAPFEGGKRAFGTAANAFADGNCFSYHICRQRNLATGSVRQHPASPTANKYK